MWLFVSLRRVWRYQRGNQNTYIEEGQTAHWPKEKVQKNKQRSTKHTHKTKDRVTRIPLKPGVNSGAPQWRTFTKIYSTGVARVLTVVS